jgi:RND superfamily putative drug exporter
VIPSTERSGATRRRLALRSARGRRRVGLARTSKVITAVALIMVSVFGAFATSTELILKLIGVGLASAILIDGILIRMVRLPGVMHLLGERAWWRRGKEDPRLSEVSAHEEVLA